MSSGSSLGLARCWRRSFGLRWGLGSGRGRNSRSSDLVCGCSKAGPCTRGSGLRWCSRCCGGRLLRSWGRGRGRILGLFRLESLLYGRDFRFLGGLLGSGDGSSWSVLGGSCLSSLLRSGGAVNSGWLRGGFKGRLFVDGLLELLIDLGQIVLALRNLVILLGSLSLRNNGGRGRLLYTRRRSSRLVLKLFLLLRILSKVAEDIVEDEVAVGLLGENEGLHESLVWLTPVGDLADDLNDNVGVGALRVDVGNTNFGLVEVEILDPLVYGLAL